MLLAIQLILHFDRICDKLAMYSSYEVGVMVMTDDDWRFRGQEVYLTGAELKYQRWIPSSPQNDHDHCELCWEKFASHENCLKMEYSTLDRYYWICEACYRDFCEQFKWRLNV